jgi:hypothetical protein
MSAVISTCKTYRYRLERKLSEGPTLMFIMVNPSTADAETNDQTIRKCLGFAVRNGFGRIIVGNKFAFRAKDVNELRTARDPIGPENDLYLQAMVAEADCIVAGWGQLAKLPEVLRSRWKDIVRLCDAAGRELHAIGTNADRHPKHPQMTAYAEGIAPWETPWFAGRTPSVTPPARETP